MCETLSDRDLFGVQDGQTCVEREGYWDLVGEGHEKHGSAGYAYPEWIVEVLLGSTYADHETVTRDSGEFLG